MTLVRPPGAISRLLEELQANRLLGRTGTVGPVQELSPAEARIATETFASPAGRAAIAIGDEITLGSTTNSAVINNARLSDSSWFTHACFLSGGRLTHKRNAGVSGDGTADMIVRFAADVAAWHPEIVFINGGANDIATLTASEIAENLATLVDMTLAIGAYPVLTTMLPTTPADPAYLTVLYEANEKIKAYGRRNKIDVIDFAAPMVDAVTGNEDTTYFLTAISPNTEGAIRVAERSVIPWLDSTWLRHTTLAPLTTWDDDPVNLLTKSTWAGEADGTLFAAPTDWAFAGVPIGGLSWSIHTPTSGESIVGKWARCNMSGTANGSTFLRQDISAGFTAGTDYILIAFKWRAVGLTGAPLVRAGVTFVNSIPAATAHPVYDWSVSDYEGYGAIIRPVINATTDIRFEIGVICNGDDGGYVEFAQPTIMNLTTLGYADEFA